MKLINRTVVAAVLMVCFLFAGYFIPDGVAQITIRGKIVNARTTAPVPDAAIKIEGTSIATNSDKEGRFNIQVPSKADTLQISHVGYRTLQTALPDSSVRRTFQLHPRYKEFRELVVTANKVQVTRETVPLTVSVIDSEELQRSGESNVLPVLSDRVPGLFVTERGVTGFGVAQGSAGSISIRGLGGSPTTRVLVLIDGNPQFMGLMGHPLPDNYVVSDARKVEVIRGPASVLYGSNAMGGVINIITRSPDRRGLDVNARAEYGFYDTRKIMANAGYQNNRLNLFASINRNSTDGHRDSSDFQITNGYFKADYDLSSNLDITGDVRLAQFEAADPGPIGGSAGERIDIMRGKTSLSLDHHTDQADGSLNAFYNFGTHDITDGWHSNDYLYGLMVHESFNLFPDNTITFGYDYMKYGGRGSPIITVLRDEQGRPIRNPAGKPQFRLADVSGEWISTHQQALYTFVRHTFNDRLTLNGGLRYQNQKGFNNALIPQVGLAWQAGEHTTLKGFFSKGYRPPSLRELFFFPPANASLRPEQSYNFEIGWNRQWPGPQMETELTLFRSEGDNLIVQQAPPYPPQYQNTGSFGNTGIEFSADYRVNEQVELRTNYAYIHMSNPMIATPVHDLFVSGDYSRNKMGINVKIRGVWDLYGQHPSGDIVTIEDQFQTVDARFSYQFSSQLKAFLQGKNLLDESYQMKYGYPMPDINISGGIEFDL